MPNPSLLEQFCSDGQKDAVSTILQTAGWSPENPNINGYQLNTIFNEIYTYLNYLKNKGLSFWEDTKTYKATAGDIDIVRYANKIYFAKLDSNLDGLTPKTPDTNPTYWGVLYDLDKPLETTYALLGGLATQTFKVSDAVNADEAVSKGQYDLKLDITDKRVPTAWASFSGIDGSIINSYNIASVVRNDVGKYTVNFIIPMADTTYSVEASAGPSSGYTGTADMDVPYDLLTTGSFDIAAKRSNGSSAASFVDFTNVYIQVFGGK